MAFLVPGSSVASAGPPTFALGHICYKQLQQKHPCLIIILTILVLEPDDGRETHGSAEQAGILLLLAPAPLGPGAGGAVHPGASTNYLKQ